MYNMLAHHHVSCVRPVLNAHVVSNKTTATNIDVRRPITAGR